ncbi:hypothetical protein PLICRDRAFT_176306 [Plicaturopsis crispa FD-325 SS-3]|nr:hypothetical protein PLICRDRAFT_176306 [Plicaturopsis crispa FD-325 SS-3]
MSLSLSREPTLHEPAPIQTVPADTVQNDVQKAPPASEKPKYAGSGTHESPYIVDWDENDPDNPYTWSRRRKWIITAQVASGTLSVSFGSSAYSAGIPQTMADLSVSREVAVLGLSLYVLGFGLGPLVFAPMSELYGRRIVFLCTYLCFVLMNLGGSLGANIATLLACRLLSGIFGASMLTNAGGSVTDVWSPRERGFATAAYSSATFLGPVFGPIIGGFVSDNPHLKWRFNFWIIIIFSAVSWAVGLFTMSETYGPVLLRRRARKLQKQSGGLVHYMSHYDLTRSTNLLEVLRINFSRPFMFFFTEPIVTLLAVYMSMSYAIMYAFFAAFPIVFQEHRHFTPGEGGLTFLGIGLGTMIGTSTVPLQTRFYARAIEKSPTGRAPPEARLPGPMLGAALLPVSLFWLAWTTEPSVHWIVPVLSGIPFGTGIVLILQGIIAYFMDAYGIYFSSAVAAGIVLRSLCAAGFPLFTPPMFDKLGDQWACSVFAFMSLLCMPMPLLFYKYGRQIRGRSKWAYHEPGPDPSADSSVGHTTVTIGEKRAGNDLEPADAKGAAR